MVESKKIEFITILRGIAIILVLIGHVVLMNGDSAPYEIFHDILYVFHMPLFFAISGFLFGLTEQDKTNVEIIKSKLIALGIPYLVFGITYIIFKTFLQSYVSVERFTSFGDILKLLYNPSHTVYWYIYDLIIFFIFSAVIRKNKKRVGAAIIISSILYLTYYFYKGVDNRWWNCGANYMFFLSAMLAGEKYKLQQTKQNIQNLLGRGKTQIMMGFVAGAIIVAFAILFLFPGHEKWFGYGFYRMILAYGGIYISVLLAVVLKKTVVLKGMISFISDKSWYIYLLHVYFMNFARNYIGKRLGVSTAGEIVIQVLAGIIGPIIGACIVEKIYILDIFFYPQRFLKIKKKIEQEQ